jgi:hypothetical protein
MRDDGRVMTGEIVTFYHDKGSDRCPCTVRIKGDSIVVSYDHEGEVGGRVIYEGEQVSFGRWTLKCPAKKANATLNLSGLDPNCLEGTWCELGEIGMWQIDVDDDD